MKKQLVILFFSFLASATTFAQKPVTITGHVASLPEGTEIQLDNYAVYSHLLGIKEKPLAVTTVKNGKFSIKLMLKEPREVILSALKPIPSNFFFIVKPGEKLTIESNSNKGFYGSKLKGSSCWDEFFNIQEKAFRGNSMPKNMTQKEYMGQIIKQHANSFYGPLLLYAYSGYNLDYESFYNLFSPQVKESFHGKALKALLDVRAADRKKREEPAFKASLANVKRTTPAYDKPENVLDAIVAQYPAKVVFVDFWATWCGPCRRGMETLKPLEPWMEENGIVRVYLSAPSSDPAKWESMVVGIGGNQYFMNETEWTAIMKRYGATGIPYYRIYNKKGECTFNQIGYPGNDKLKEEFQKAI